LVGKRLAEKYDWEKLLQLHEGGRLEAFLKAQDAWPLEGWLGDTGPLRGTKVVVDHDLWSYFTRRFGLEVVAKLEPLPGVPPTSKHLQAVVALARAEGVKVILASPYYDPRHAAVVAKETGAKVLPMAHQTGGRPDTDDYLAMIGSNVRELRDALKPNR
jgi:ABC-type Zn uptake system ZnuABC Zn-binding protein ZnuA